jgi:hypothetical protein
MDLFLIFLIFCFFSEVAAIILYLMGMVIKGPQHMKEKYFRLSKRFGFGFFLFLFGVILYILLA